MTRNSEGVECRTRTEREGVGLSRILVVDDDSETRYLLGLALDGYDVETVTGGEEAIDLLENNPDYDAIIVAADMPVTNGWEVARIVKDEYNGWPMKVIVMCQGLDADDFLKACTIGVDHTINKPIHPPVLVRVLKELL